MQNTNTQEQAENDVILDAILLKPSGELITDRFVMSAETGAVCGAACSGECHGIV